VDERILANGLEALRNEGFAVELGQNIYGRKGYLAGDAEGRARDLIDFFGRDDIDAIICARGGFGSVQLLPILAKENGLKPKIFAGYSDITVLLNWFVQKFEMVTFHAPMVGMEIAAGLSGRTKQQFWGTLTGEIRNWTIDLAEVIRPGVAEAMLIGGCLSLLVTTVGTPYEIETAGKLLFIEDVDEKPYRIERMLTHLKLAGKLNSLSGVVCGDFTRCQGDSSRGLREVISDVFRDAPYPVVMGMAAGHGQENLVLPLGVKMELNAESATLSLIESPVA
jgi:muramoyltetrapeptide carboxypeptidase